MTDNAKPINILLNICGVHRTAAHLKGVALEFSTDSTRMSEQANHSLDTVFRTRRLISPRGETAGAVAVREGAIVGIEPYDSPLDATQQITLAPDEVLLPGIVDVHVHVNDPGRAEWEGFPTATGAAAAGGITTILDMPLNSVPPTTTAEALRIKRDVARDRAHVDVGFWGGVVPDNLNELRRLHESGVYGVKAFLLHSGVDEFPGVDASQLEAAMYELAEYDGLLIVHAEDAATVEHAPDANGRSYEPFLRSRPGTAETVAISIVLDLARRTGCRVHIVHLSTSDALESLAEARADGVRVTVETCPHYLTFSSEEIPDGATEFKCCPPIREAENRESLWQGLEGGVIDYIVTDHSPCVPELKEPETGNFGTAWGGISSLQVSLPAVWTQARARGHDLAQVVSWMATRPATLLGVRGKGSLETGNDADLCVFAPEETFLVDARELWHRNPISAYHGRRLAGTVRQTWLRGRCVHDAATSSSGQTPRGRLLSRQS